MSMCIINTFKESTVSLLNYNCLYSFVSIDNVGGIWSMFSTVTKFMYACMNV